jgi:hypothetical protein
MNYSTPLAMAQSLAYLPCPSTIRAHVQSHFGRAPSIERCAAIRAAYVKERTPRRKPDTVDSYKLKFRCKHPTSADNIYVMSTGSQVCATCKRDREETASRAQLQRWMDREERERRARERKRLLELEVGIPCGRSIRQIIENAAELFEVDVDDITGPLRIKRFYIPRFAVCMAAAAVNWPVVRIGRELGGRDHSTVSSAMKRGREMAARDPEFAHAVRLLSKAAGR